MVLAKYRGKILTNNKQLICSYLPLQHDLMKALVLTMNRSRMSRWFLALKLVLSHLINHRPKEKFHLVALDALSLSLSPYLLPTEATRRRLMIDAEKDDDCV